MSQSELLKKTALVLHRLGVPFMLTGSLASSLQGEPRETHDIDLVVNFSSEQTEGLVSEFSPPDYYLSRQAIAEAVTQCGMFNLLDLREGDNVDFWMLSNDAFDESRFARRQQLLMDDVLIEVSSPEDTILMKLRWALASGTSEKHFHDALRVYEVQHRVLDEDYLRHWVQALKLDELWQRLPAEAQPLE